MTDEAAARAKAHELLMRCDAVGCVWGALADRNVPPHSQYCDKVTALIVAHAAEVAALKVERDHWRDARRRAMDAAEHIKAERDAALAEVERLQGLLSVARREANNDALLPPSPEATPRAETPTTETKETSK